ncbi:MAG TPA: glycosyltransferase family 2 protein [Acidimicrobiales bacterium]|nr:glycosyltransferase family 2 protein [Acidimicrobiales bacterium]
MVSSSVVVVSHRPGSWLAECLASALPQASEVVLVDNGSAGEEASDIGRRSGATVVRAARNLGFAGGVNLGLRHVHGEIVGLLNDDAVAGPGWLDAARSVLTDPTIAAVTPKVVLDGVFAEIILDDDVWFSPGDPRPLGRLLHSVTVAGREVLEDVLGAGVYDSERAVVEGRPSLWRWTAGATPFYVPLAGPDPADSIRVNGEPVTVRSVCTLINHAGNFLERHGIAGDYGFAAPDDGRFDQPAERFGFSGTAPVFRAATLATVGGFATPFFAYNEDTDWCLRARLAGLRIVYDPQASVRHHRSATSGGAASAFVRFLAQRNALLCLVRNAPSDVAGPLVWSTLRRGPDRRVRRSMMAKLPWAVTSRLRMQRHWSVSPHEVWDRWAGADTGWDTRPAHSPGVEH